LKEEICKSVLIMLDKKIKTVQESISYIQEARNNETKSSAGDKYETSRVMMQAELDKQSLLLQQFLQQKNVFLKIQRSKPSEKIDFGSWVETNQGNYLIAVGIGKVKEGFVISLASPLGKALKGLRIGDKTSLQNKEYRITTIK